jgi:hypothetical protein
MGFGLGQANEDVASFADNRNSLGRFDLILSQDAVAGPLRNRGLPPQPMHGHHNSVYVDTLHAVAFGLLKVKDLFAGEQLELEIIAHERQNFRARKEALLAVKCLSCRGSVAEFLQRVTISELQPPGRMRMNEWSLNNLKHFWTCSSLLYWLFDNIFPIPLKSHFSNKRYERDHEHLYARLTELNRLLRQNSVYWHCDELQ